MDIIKFITLGLFLFQSVEGSIKFLGFGSYPDQNSTCISYYYFNDVVNLWERANMFCNSVFGSDASLVNIESFTELEVIINALDALLIQEVRYFWTGGEFNIEADSFVWSNGVPLDNIPWGRGFPNSKLATTRVSVVSQMGDPAYQTHHNSVSLGYICEQQICSP